MDNKHVGIVSYHGPLPRMRSRRGLSFVWFATLVALLFATSWAVHIAYEAASRALEATCKDAETKWGGGLSSSAPANQTVLPVPKRAD